MKAFIRAFVLVLIGDRHGRCNRLFDRPARPQHAPGAQPSQEYLARIMRRFATPADVWSMTNRVRPFLAGEDVKPSTPAAQTRRIAGVS